MINIIEQTKEDNKKHKGSNLKRLSTLHERVSNLPDAIFLVLMFICAYIMAVITSPLYDVFVDMESFDTSFFGFTFDETFLIAVIIGPFFETIYYQCLPIEICSFIYRKSRKLKPNYVLIILLSSSLFGLMHYPAYAAVGGITFGIIKVINSFSIGLVLAYTYLVYKLKAGNAIIATSILHMMLNFSFLMLPRLYELIR